MSHFGTSLHSEESAAKMEIFYNILCPVKKVPVQTTRSHIHLLGECGPLLWVLPWSSLLLLLESTLGDDGGKGGTDCNIILLPSLNPPEELDPITRPLWGGETRFWLVEFTLRDVVRVGSFIISFTIMLTSLQSDPGPCLLRPPRDSGGFIGESSSRSESVSLDTISWSFEVSWTST